MDSGFSSYFRVEGNTHEVSGSHANHATVRELRQNLYVLPHSLNNWRTYKRSVYGGTLDALEIEIDFEGVQLIPESIAPNAYVQAAEAGLASDSVDDELQRVDLRFQGLAFGFLVGYFRSSCTSAASSKRPSPICIFSSVV